jgi:hypothetical protein
MFSLQGILTALALAAEVECGLDRGCFDREITAVRDLGRYAEKAEVYDDYKLQNTIVDCYKMAYPYATITLDCVIDRDLRN